MVNASVQRIKPAASGSFPPRPFLVSARWVGVDASFGFNTQNWDGPLCVQWAALKPKSYVRILQSLEKVLEKALKRDVFTRG